MTARRTLPPETEAGFLAAVIDVAQQCGWKVAHFRPARTGRGAWRTPVQGDGVGFPDLVLVRPPLPNRPARLIVAEGKSARGRLSAAQQAWIEILCHCPGIEVYVWKPQDWSTIHAVLR